LLQANNININTQEDTTIQGANLHANQQLNINTNNLAVSSVQNTASSNSNSKSLNLSTSGFTPTGAGGSLSKSSSSSAQTLLTSLSAEEVNINVEEATTLKGATIASTDQDGNDNNNLNLTTNTLNVSSLNNTSNSKSISVGANIGGSFENNTLNNVSIDFSNNTTNKKTKTLATLGSGNIQITDQTSSDTSMLNRDIANNEVDIYNISSHKGLQGELDTRLLTQEGRKQIAEDIERTIRTGEAIGDVATKESIEITDTFDHIGDVQKDLDVQKALSLADNGKIIDILDDKNREKYTQQERDNALNEYAQIYAGIYNIDIQSAKSAIIADKYGSTYTNQENTSSNIFIDNAKNSGALDTANTMGHEVAHARMNQGQTRERIGDLAEEYANTFGEYSADGMEFSSSTYNNVNLNSNSPTTIPTPKTTADITTLTNNTNEYLGDSAKADAGVGRMDDSPLLFIPLAIVALENYGNTPQSKEDIQTGPTDNINLLVGAGTVLKAGQIYQGSKTVVTTALKYDPSLTLTGAGVATGTSAYTNYDKYDGTEYATHVATDGAISFLVGKYIPAGNSMGTSIGYGTLGGSASGFLSELGHQATDTYVFDNQANMNYQNIFLNSAIEGAAGATGKFYNSMGDMMNGGHIINDAVDMGVSQSFKPVIESQRNSFDNQTKQEAE
jgi:filamentous hemagglutinin